MGGQSREFTIMWSYHREGLLPTGDYPRHFQHLTELAPSDVPMKPLKSSIVTFPLFFTKSLNPIYCRAIIFTSGGTFAFQNNHRII